MGSEVSKSKKKWHWSIYGFRRKLIHSGMLFMLQCESVNGLLIALGNGTRGGGGYEKFC